MSERKATYNPTTTTASSIQEMLDALYQARFVDFDSKRYMEVNEWLLEHTKYGYYYDHEQQRYVARQSIDEH